MPVRFDNLRLVAGVLLALAGPLGTAAWAEPQPGSAGALAQRAKAGNPQAMKALGDRAMLGALGGDTTSAAEAAAWYRKAADLGLASAMNRLGECYDRGVGVAKNAPEGFRWKRLAAERGDADGEAALGRAYLLGEQVPASIPEGLRWLSAAAGQGQAWAVMALYELYQNGHPGLAADPARALAWLKQGAMASVTEAEREYGRRLTLEAASEAAFAEGLTWLRRAATAGDADAMVLLGDALAEGKIVAADPAAAAVWYRQAALTSDEGMLRLGTCYASGLGVPRDLAASLHWYRQAAQAGNPRAMALVGLCYLKGVPVARDVVEAYAWTLGAVELEDVPARGQLEVLKARMTHAQMAAGDRRAEALRHEADLALERARAELARDLQGLAPGGNGL